MPSPIGVAPVAIANPPWPLLGNWTSTDLSQNHTIRLTAGALASVDWGDGSALQIITGTGADQAIAHNYAGAGTYRQIWRVREASKLLRYYGISNGLIGAISPLFGCTAVTYYLLNGNLLTGGVPALALPSCTVFRCQSNTSLGGTLVSISGMPAITELNVQICALGGAIPSLTANTALATAYFNNNTFTGYTASVLASTIVTFNAATNQLPQAAIDQILADFATNVAARPAVGTITLGGVGNAAPSAAGLASKAAILAAKPGWTITHN